MFTSSESSKPHKEALGIHPIRAVLIETTDEDRGNRLMDMVNHPPVSGPQKRAGLFWFTISPLFTDLAKDSPSVIPQATFFPSLPRYLLGPEIILDPISVLPDRTMHSLADQANSPALASA
jgi:hypothetical protein